MWAHLKMQQSITNGAGKQAGVINNNPIMYRELSLPLFINFLSPLLPKTHILLLKRRKAHTASHNLPRAETV